MEGKKTKKLTKKQMIDSIPKIMDSELKKNYIKNLVQGSEIAYNMMLDYINQGHMIDEVKSFIEMNIKNREAIENITLGEKDEIPNV